MKVSSVIFFLCPAICLAGLPQAPLQPAAGLPSTAEKLVEIHSLAGVGSSVQVEYELPRDESRFLEVRDEDTVEDAFVDTHNEERAIWGQPSVSWRSDIATAAAAHAATCTFAHSTSASRTHGTEYWGENLAASTASSNDVEEAEKRTRSWIGEKIDWNCGNVGGGSDCRAGKPCGHLTQVIWHDSTEIGCAIQHCTTGSPFGGGSWVFTVCQYHKGGNYGGQHPFGSSTAACSHCTNGVKDYDETDVDCGASCVGFLQSSGGGKCAADKVCKVNSDCGSGLVCHHETLTCSAPSSTCASSGDCVCSNAAGTSTKYVKVKCGSGTLVGYTLGNSISAGGTRTVSYNGGICKDCTLCSEGFTGFSDLVGCS